ncbi:MAG TPA: hypothetical protein VIH37_07385, partial [Candidatus Limnocylindrales bacterium]
MATTSFYSQIAANRRNSVLLALVVMLLLGILGFAIGGALSGSASAAAVATGIAIFAGLGAALFSYFSGDALVLASSGAREIDATQAPELFDVVQEMSIAAGVP